MSSQMMKYCRTFYVGSITDKSILHILSQSATAEGRAFKTHKEIAKEANSSIATVKRSLRRLKEKGLVIANQFYKTGGKAANCYDLNQVFNNNDLTIAQPELYPAHSELSSNNNLRNNINNNYISNTHTRVPEEKEEIKKEKEEVAKNLQTFEPPDSGPNHIARFVQRVSGIFNPSRKPADPYNRLPPPGFTEFFTEYPAPLNESWAHLHDKTLMEWAKLGCEDDAEQIINDVKLRKQHHKKWKSGYISNPISYLKSGVWMQEYVIEEEPKEEEKEKRPVAKKPLAEHKATDLKDYIVEIEKLYNASPSLNNLLLLTKFLAEKYTPEYFFRRNPVDCLGEWERIAGKYSEKTLSEALKFVNTRYPDYPPSPVQFNSLCEPTEVSKTAFDKAPLIQEGGCKVCKNPDRPAKNGVCFCCKEGRKVNWNEPDFKNLLEKSYPGDDFYSKIQKLGMKEAVWRLEYIYLHGDYPTKEAEIKWREDNAP